MCGGGGHALGLSEGFGGGGGSSQGSHFPLLQSPFYSGCQCLFPLDSFDDGGGGACVCVCVLRCRNMTACTHKCFIHTYSAPEL